jgi:hypothetical protein
VNKPFRPTKIEGKTSLREDARRETRVNLHTKQKPRSNSFTGAIREVVKQKSILEMRLR